MAFQPCGIPQCPFEQLKDVLLCTVIQYIDGTLQNMFRLFLPCFQPLPTPPVQGEGDEQQKRLQESVWTESQSSVPSLKFLVFTSLQAELLFQK